METALDQIADLLALEKRERLSLKVMADLEPYLRMSLPSKAINRVRQACGVTIDDFAPIFGTSRRNLFVLLKRNNVDAYISDRLYRVVSVIVRAINVFGSRKKASEWMKMPLQSLGGDTPISKLDNEIGATRVLEVLGAIEHGVYA